MNRIDTTHIVEAIEQYEALADGRETVPIKGDTISAWHYEIGHLDKPVVEEAIAIHHKTNPEPIQPEHILEIAAHIQSRTETKPRMRRAVMTTYTLTGAINDPCDNCGAQPGDTCINPVTEQESHAPCVSRLVGKRAAA
jgi:hypothetical protein